MNASGAALLTNPHPCRHIVYPYTDEGLVGQAVCLFASSGLRAGEGVILIMTSDHFESIRLRLSVEGFDVDAYERSGGEPTYGLHVGRELVAAFGQLTDAQRRVIVLKLFDGRSFGEIATLVGSTESACRMRFSRGLGKLREELERKGIER